VRRSPASPQSSNNRPATIRRWRLAYRGNAAGIVSLDDRLRSAEAGANLREHLDVSVRSPDAFNAVVDPAAIYELAFEEPYPGPDRAPR